MTESTGMTRLEEEVLAGDVIREMANDPAKKAALELHLGTRFPQCTRHYTSRRREYGTTWDLEPGAAVILFTTVGDRPFAMDYTLYTLDPKPKQQISVRDIQGPLERVCAMSVLFVYEQMNAERTRELYQR